MQQENLAFRPFMDEADFDRITRPPTINALLRECRGYGELPACAWSGQERSFEELAADVARTRGFLLTLGLPPGARVGLLMGNDYDFVRLFYALVTLGCTAVPFMMNTPPEALIAMIHKSELSALIYGEMIAPLAQNLRPAAPALRFLAASGCGYGAEAPESADVAPATPAVILFTSGTTGKPKGTVLSHGALMRGAFNGCFGYRGVFHQRYYALIPFAHVFGLVRSLLTAHLTGSLLYLCLDMKAFVRDLPVARPSIMALVPALADALYSIAMGYGMDALGGNLRLIIAGGAPVPPSLIQRFGALGIMVAPGYGLTETANLVSGNPAPGQKPDSVGLIYEGQDYRLVDGELWLKGDNLMLGYYNDPEETAAAMQDGYFRTGDLARVDAEGYLYITGRIKNLIILPNGENVSPEELENLVCTLPIVKDCLVQEDVNDFGIPIIAARVFPDDRACAAAGITDALAAIQAGVLALNRKLPSYKQIVKVTLSDTDFLQGGTKKVR